MRRPRKGLRARRRAMAVVAGRSTESLDRMPEQSERSSINRHFRREGMIQQVIFLVTLALAVLMAFVGPWLFELFR